MVALKAVAVGLVLGGAGVLVPGGQQPAAPPAAVKKQPTPAERLKALQAEREADYKATLHKGKDQRTGEEIDIGSHVPINKYKARILELADGPDEATAAAALSWACHQWNNPDPAESDDLFRRFVKRFGTAPHAAAFAKNLVAVDHYGGNGQRVRRLLEVCGDRPARAELELNLAYMADPTRGGKWHAEPAANLTLRRDLALVQYDRLAAEYADLDGGKLAATAKKEAERLRAAMP